MLQGKGWRILYFVLFAMFSSLSVEAEIGKDWTLVTESAPWPSRIGHTSVVFDGKIWIIGGEDSEPSSYNDVWYSEDGVSWTAATLSAPWSARSNHTSVVHNGKIWVIGGRINDVWYSEDGVTWTAATLSAPWDDQFTSESSEHRRAKHSSVVFDGKIWLIAGETGKEYVDGDFRTNDVWYSEDGTTWTPTILAAPWSIRCDHTLAVYDNKIWVIGGWNPTWTSGEEKNDVWYSLNGADWVQMMSSAEWSARFDHTTVVFNNNIWLLGGGGEYGYKNDVWYFEMPIAAISPSVWRRY